MGRRRSGFLLVEVLIAVLILTIALTSLIDVIRAGIDSNSLTQEMTLAMSLAQQKMWEAEATFLWGDGEEGFDEEGIFKKHDGYRFEVEIEPNDERAEAVVAVTVYWDHGRTRKSYQLATVVPLERNPEDLKSEL